MAERFRQRSIGKMGPRLRGDTPFLLVAVTALTFSSAIVADFQLDDFADVVGNDAAKAATFFASLPDTLRPLLKATYALQDLIHGPWAPGFHIVNVALHLAATALVYILARRAMPQPAWFAGSAAALWAVHPAMAETVTYVSGRSAGLAGLLMLAALVLATGPRPRWRWAFVGALLAPLVRETAIILPFLLLWWQLTLGGSPRRGWPVWLGTSIGAAVAFALPRHREYLGFSLGARDPLEALRLNVPALYDIVGAWLLPWRVSADPADPLPWGWTETPMLWWLAGLALAIAAGLVLRRRAPLVAFAIGLTMLALLPANSLVWRTDPVSMRPLYLASIGLAFLVAASLARLGRPGVFAALLLVTALATMTWQRGLLYGDAVALWQDAAEKAPGKARPWFMLGYAWLARDDLDAAEAAIRRGLRRAPGSYEGRNALDLIEGLRAVDAP